MSASCFVKSVFSSRVSSRFASLAMRSTSSMVSVADILRCYRLVRAKRKGRGGEQPIV